MLILLRVFPGEGASAAQPFRKILLSTGVFGPRHRRVAVLVSAAWAFQLTSDHSR